MEGENAWYELVEAALLGILEASGEGILVFDHEGRCRMIGRTVGELFGLDPAAHVAKPRDAVLQALARACENPDVFLASTQAYDPAAPSHTVGEVVLLSPAARVVTWSGHPMALDGRSFGQVNIVREVLRERTWDPRSLADPARFRVELVREHARAARSWDSYAVLRVWAQSGVDQVAEALATRRSYDVAAVLETDELGVLLPGADAVAARGVTDRLLTVVPQACVGVSVWKPPSTAAADEVLFAAAVALARAREIGPGTCVSD